MSGWWLAADSTLALDLARLVASEYKGWILDAGW